MESDGRAMHMSLEAITLAGQRRTVATYTGMIQIEDIAADGRVLITAGTLRYSAHVEREGRPYPRDLSVFDATRVFHLSPDGQQVLLWDNSPGALWDNSPGAPRDMVFVRHADGAPAIPLGPGAPAALSPDGALAAVIGNGVSSERIRNKLDITADWRRFGPDVRPAH